MITEIKLHGGCKVQIPKSTRNLVKMQTGSVGLRWNQRFWTFNKLPSNTDGVDTSITV